MRQLKITESITNRESQSVEKYLQDIAKVVTHHCGRRGRLGSKNPCRRSGCIGKIGESQPSFRGIGSQAIPSSKAYPLNDLINEKTKRGLGERAAQKFEHENQRF
jgi:hypothetical protein